MSKEYKMKRAIEHWARGYISSAALLRNAKRNGYVLERAGLRINAVGHAGNFSVRG